MRNCILFFVLCILLPSSALSEEFNIDQSIADRYFQGNIHKEREAKKLGNPRFCNKYIAMDMGSDADGPLYYLNKNDGSIFTICGGACMVPANQVSDPLTCKECPPKDLNCEGMCETLTCSVLNNDPKSAEKLLNRKQNPNEYFYADKNGTVLQYAAARGEQEIVDMLLSAGADPNIQDAEGYTPIWVAKNDPDIVRALIKAGADTSLKYNENFNGHHSFTLMEYAQDWLKNHDPNSTSRQELILILKEAELSK